jgi:hypothetical protein
LTHESLHDDEDRRHAEHRMKQQAIAAPFCCAAIWSVMALNCLHGERSTRQLLGDDLPRPPFTGAAVHDPQRHFAPVNCRTAKGSFDHLVSGHKKGLRHGKAEHLCGLEVDNQLELGRLQDGQVLRLSTFENSADIYGR